jgi:hypothetical protein
MKRETQQQLCSPHPTDINNNIWQSKLTYGIVKISSSSPMHVTSSSESTTTAFSDRFAFNLAWI